MLQKYYFVFQLFGCGTYKWSFINFWLDLPVQCHFFFFVKSSSPFISAVLALKQGDSHYKKMDGQSLTESIVRTLHDIEAAQAFFNSKSTFFFFYYYLFHFFFLLGGRWRKVSNWVWTCSWEGKVWNREW